MQAVSVESVETFKQNILNFLTERKSKLLEIIGNKIDNFTEELRVSMEREIELLSQKEDFPELFESIFAEMMEEVKLRIDKIARLDDSLRSYDTKGSFRLVNNYPIEIQIQPINLRLPLQQQLQTQKQPKKTSEKPKPIINFAFECKYCHKELPSEALARNHLKLEHDDESWYQCPNCDFTAEIIKGFIPHLMRMHGKDNTRLPYYQCPFTGKQFRRQQELSKHIRLTYQYYVHIQKNMKKKQKQPRQIQNDSDDDDE